MKPGEITTLFMDWGNGLVILDFKLLDNKYEFNGKTYFGFEAQCKTPFISWLTVEQVDKLLPTKTSKVKTCPIKVK
jgi:hypothetical protein